MTGAGKDPRDVAREWRPRQAGVMGNGAQTVHLILSLTWRCPGQLGGYPGFSFSQLIGGFDLVFNGFHFVENVEKRRDD